MDKILVVSNLDKTSQILEQLITTTVFSSVTLCKSIEEAKEILSFEEFSVVVISAPLGEEFGHEFSKNIMAEGITSVILLVKEDVSSIICEKVESFGVLVCTKPINKALFSQALKFALTSRKRLVDLQHKNNTLKEKITEIRLVDRAKCILIQYLKMTEQQAHRYIEKQAMDMRVTRKEVAQDILKIYEF